MSEISEKLCKKLAKILDGTPFHEDRECTIDKGTKKARLYDNGDTQSLAFGKTTADLYSHPIGGKSI